MAVKSYIDAVREAMDLALGQDENVLIFGEDVGKNGGVFRATDGLQAKYGEDRVFNTPLAESGIGGLAIGLTTQNYRPVMEIQFFGFVFEVMDSIAGQMARNRFRFGGTKRKRLWSVHLMVVARRHRRCMRITWKALWPKFLVFVL